MRDAMQSDVPPRLPKVCGADFELGNFILGSDAVCSGPEASRVLLAAIEGLPRRQFDRHSNPAPNWQTVVYGARGSCGQHLRCISKDSDNAQDWGRKFLVENGGCVYIDLDHLECCIPEVTNVWDHVAASHAMLRIVKHALRKANQAQPDGRKIQVLVNNSDGQGNSYGSHLNFLITRRAWENLFHRKCHHLQYLASFQVSSLVYTGQGKVGSENGAPAAAYQLSQRADYFERISSYPTTFARGLVNSRDEALSGPAGKCAEPDAPARLHSIFFDNTLAHGSSLLKVGVMQVILAMLEAEHCNPALILDDPVDAVVQISHDPTLETCVKLASGSHLTALELQEQFLTEARTFAEQVGFDGIVPRAAEILDLWEDTLTKLKAGNLPALAPRLDWVMKLMAIERALDQRRDLDWNSPEIKHLDHLYSSLDTDGLYFAYESSGFAELLVPEQRIDELTSFPPEDTRAWARTMLLRCAGAGAVDSVDWDSISFKLRGRNHWPAYRKVSLGTPLSFTRAEAEPMFHDADSLEDVLDAMDAANRANSSEPESTDSPSGTKPRELVN